MSSGRKRKAVKYAESSSSGSEKEDSSDDDFGGGGDARSSAAADNEDDDLSFSGHIDNGEKDGEDDDEEGNASDDTERLMQSLKERFIDKKKTPTKQSKATAAAASKMKEATAAKNGSATKQPKTTKTTTKKAATLVPAASSGVNHKKTTKAKSPSPSKTALATPESGSPAKKTKVSSSSASSSLISRIVDKSKYDSMDVLLPSQLLGLGGGGGCDDDDNTTAPPGSCSVLIQVPPEISKGLDFEGVSGAIGRLEVLEDSGCLVLDLKGCQYQASIVPGPTAMVVGFVPTKVGTTMASSSSSVPQLRVDAITDEFATLVKTNDSMLQLDAKVQGDYNNDGNERFGVVEDDNVNKRGATTTGADGSASAKKARK